MLAVGSHEFKAHKAVLAGERWKGEGSNVGSICCEMEGHNFDGGLKGVGCYVRAI